MEILQMFWLYGGSYFGALATASSFYALFFFFWTRTGDRGSKVDLETKMIYMNPIYITLRVSLLMIILAKIVEIFIVTTFAQASDVPVSILGIMISYNGAFLYTVIALTALNSFLMSHRLINFTYAIPMAVVSYFYIFIYSTRNVYADINGYFIPAGEALFIQFGIYIASVIVFASVFNYFSRRVRNKHKNNN